MHVFCYVDAVGQAPTVIAYIVTLWKHAASDQPHWLAEVYELLSSFYGVCICGVVITDIPNICTCPVGTDAL